MTPAEAKTELSNMRRQRELNGGLCPSCACQDGQVHRPNCQWLVHYITIERLQDTGSLIGPNLKWGDPVGTYEIEIVPGGAFLYYRQPQPSGGMLEIKIPLTTKALAEMQRLVGMLEFGVPVEVPDGRIRAN